MDPKATVVRTRPTRTQKAWWAYLAFIGGLSAAGSVGIIYEHGPERGLWPAIIWPGLLVSIAAFASGKVLRQRRTAERTVISVSEDGLLRILEPGNGASRSLVGARTLSFHHGTTVAEMYGAEIPPGLASSGPYGAAVIETEVGVDVMTFAGELPSREQTLLLEAARPFLVEGVQAASPTPDERYYGTSFRRRLLDFFKFLGTVIVLLLPVLAVGAIQLAVSDDLDPNTLWFAVLLCVAGAAVLIVLWVRWRKR